MPDVEHGKSASLVRDLCLTQKMLKEIHHPAWQGRNYGEDLSSGKEKMNHLDVWIDFVILCCIASLIMQV
jgi:hypothetical protein